MSLIAELRQRGAAISIQGADKIALANADHKLAQIVATNKAQIVFELEMERCAASTSFVNDQRIVRSLRYKLADLIGADPFGGGIDHGPLPKVAFDLNERYWKALQAGEFFAGDWWDANGKAWSDAVNAVMPFLFPASAEKVLSGQPLLDKIKELFGARVAASLPAKKPTFDASAWDEPQQGLF
jgi:hypothetical protein